VEVAVPEALILDAVRTPIGRYGGALKDVRPDDLAALVVEALLKRTGLDPNLVEDVYLGCTNQAGEDNRNVARMALLLAGLPVSVAGATVNRLCGSGMEAVASAARAIRCGDGDVFVAGGVESMTRAPLVVAKAESAFPRGEATLYDSTLGWRFVNPRLAAMHPPWSMGETAENVAERTGIRREEQDRYSLRSQQRWAAAQQAGRFRDEIVPVAVQQKKGGPQLVDTDEHPRPEATPETLAGLPSVFRKGGTVTAGNSSGINDGAAALLLSSMDRARELGLKPMARVVAAAVVGVDPAYMGLGPIPAVRKVLQRTGLALADMDLIELNEAFAVQTLACARELGIDQDRMNVNGGAIAMGHPLGCTGARILTTLVHEMRRRRAAYGLAAMCIGVGMGMAMVLEGIR
jgi:3-oxoadipyl-CoA thiolase